MDVIYRLDRVIKGTDSFATSKNIRASMGTVALLESKDLCLIKGLCTILIFNDGPSKAILMPMGFRSPDNIEIEPNSCISLKEEMSPKELSTYCIRIHEDAQIRVLCFFKVQETSRVNQIKFLVEDGLASVDRSLDRLSRYCKNSRDTE